jgi:phosphoglycerate kinase
VRTIRDLQLSGRRAFIRVDFNVPIEQKRITDDTRIRAALPTISYALERGATVILASHLGRPKGKATPEFTLKPIAERLKTLLGRPVVFASDCVGPAAEEAIAAHPRGVILLENLRFHPEEEANDPGFAQQLAALAEVYINDAFGAAHRAHASTEGIVQFVKDAAAGFLMADEVEYLGKVLGSPDRPFVAVLGGAKVSGKLEVIQSLVTRVDTLLIGGAMAYTFLKAQGKPVGGSRVEDVLIGEAKAVLEQATRRGVALELPIDHVVAPKLEATAPTDILPVGDPRIGDRLGLDIGPETVSHYADILGRAKTVVWNGPMGVFEIPAFAKGTVGIAQAVAKVHGTTIVGGGDSVAAVTQAGVADEITHISTGGGASLEWLGGRTLPGVAVLPEA